MSLESLPTGELAAVVTYLEMREQPPAIVPASSLSLEPLEPLSPATYRDLFRLVGAPWLWFSRLVMSDAELASIIHHADVDVLVVRDGSGTAAGFLELDFRHRGECELGYVGLVPALAGQGHGRWLLAEAVQRAWRPGVERVHVHTCTLDHPAALSTYRRAGFVPFKRAIERFADPRVTGLLPADVAPQVALLGTPASSAHCA